MPDLGIIAFIVALCVGLLVAPSWDKAISRLTGLPVPDAPTVLELLERWLAKLFRL